MFAKRTKGKFANGKLGFLPTVSAKSLEPRAKTLFATRGKQIEHTYYHDYLSFIPMK